MIDPTPNQEWLAGRLLQERAGQPVTLDDVRLRAIVEWCTSRPTRPLEQDLAELDELARVTLEDPPGLVSIDPPAADPRIPARGLWVQLWRYPKERGPRGGSPEPTVKSAWHLSTGAGHVSEDCVAVWARCGFKLQTIEGRMSARRFVTREDPPAFRCGRCLRCSAPRPRLELVQGGTGADTNLEGVTDDAR